MKPVIIIAIAVVLLIPSIAFAELSPFVDPNQDPQYYVDRYNNEITYREWFDKNYPDITIYDAVGLPEPEPEPEPESEPESECGDGSELIRGECIDIYKNFGFPPADTGDEWTKEEYNYSYRVLIGTQQYHEALKLVNDAKFYFDVDIDFLFLLDEYRVLSKLSMHKEALEVIREFDKKMEASQTKAQKEANFANNIWKYEEAKSLYSLGKYSSAIKVAEEAILDLEGKRFAYGTDLVVIGSSATIIALSSEKQGNYDRATQFFNLASQNFVIRNLDCYKANYLMEMGNYEQAIQVVDNAPADTKCGAITERVSLQDTKTESLKRLEVIEPSGVKLSDSDIICGKGTIEKNGRCVPDTKSSKGGGCLIATATYGSELAPQIQQLRELRDNKLLQTESGTSFINSFNDFYYSFSPIIADYERENPVFREMVKIAITPLISSLSILNYVDMDSEVEVLGYGISLILLNIGMYFTIPAIIIMRIRK